VLKNISIKAKRREISGRKASRKLARLGYVPGVLYGADKPPANFQVDSRKFDLLLHGDSSSTLFNFEIEGVEGSGVTIIKDIQHDPLTGNLIHADLFRISMDKPLNLKVQVHLSGTPIGVKAQGGVLDFVTRAIDISCLPADIPERLDVDVSGIEIGHSIRISDLNLSDKLTLHMDPNTPIMTVVAPAAEKALAAVEEGAAVAPAAEGAEPEVIKKGKAEDDEKKEGGPEKKDKKD
jgi:large subunit ribosomal protein L25